PVVHAPVIAPTTPRPPAAPAVDLDPPTRRGFDAWRDGRLKQIYDEAHSGFREAVAFAEVEPIHELFAKAAGRFVKLGDPIENSRDGDVRIASGAAIFDK